MTSDPVRGAEDVVDPVQVHEAWIATCDSCGWHTQPASPMGVVREWARLHRVTCPLKPTPADGIDIPEVKKAGVRGG